MADERLKLVIEGSVRHNENLPGNQAFTRQRVQLVDNQGSPVVTADAYLDQNRFYSVYWQTHTSAGALVELAEETLKRFERQFPRGVATIDKKTRRVTTPKAVELLWKAAAIAHLDVGIHPRKEYRSGIILFTSEKPDGSGRRLTFPLQRPLSYERLERLSSQRPISFARMNTPVGDFCITGRDDGRSFGCLTDLTQPEGFARPLELTAEKGISHDEAMNFLGTVIGLFETR